MSPESPFAPYALLPIVAVEVFEVLSIWQNAFYGTRNECECCHLCVGGLWIAESAGEGRGEEERRHHGTSVNANT